MTGLENISKIGFGTYRLTLADKAAHRALKYALKSGCNVIDTAPNYALGEAETAIGKLLPAFDRKKVFLMTKAGYAQGLSSAEISAIGLRHFTRLPGGQLHSVHPDFLYSRLRQSLQRLGTSYTDGFFLHNPHYLTADGQLQQTLASAFEFLEDMVDRGFIKYYGVSSAALGVRPESILNIDNIEAIAARICSVNHLKLFQFPLNIIENEVLTYHRAEMNVVLKCKQKGYTTFSNRPLNAYLPDGSLIRLAGCTRKMTGINEMENQFQRICEGLAALGQHSMRGLPEWSDLLYRREHFSSAEEVEVFFHQRLLPVLAGILKADDPAVEDLLHQLHFNCIKKANNNMAGRTTAFFNHIYAGSGLRPTDYAPAAVSYCQLKGVDCVLTASRKQAYFKEIEHLI